MSTVAGTVEIGGEHEARVRPGDRSHHPGELEEVVGIDVGEQRVHGDDVDGPGRHRQRARLVEVSSLWVVAGVVNIDPFEREPWVAHRLLQEHDHLRVHVDAVVSGDGDVLVEDGPGELHATADVDDREPPGIVPAQDTHEIVDESSGTLVDLSPLPEPGMGAL